jgi:sec-independent protein translocase protein TatB
VFGVSLTEAVVIGLVALVFVGPQKLPKMMRTVGEWIAKLRRMTQDVRAQTGIDDVLRAEGIEGGLSELRSMLRGDFPIARGLEPARPGSSGYDDPYAGQVDFDRWREWPTEGCDAYGALPDDLIDEEPAPALPANGAASTSAAEA